MVLKVVFFDFLHNLKDFITEKFASFKETLISLDILKGEITSSSSREDTVSNSVHSNPEAAAVMVSESSEREHVSLKDKLTQICVRSRTYGGVNKDINDYNQVIDYYEQNTSGTVRIKFQRPVRMFGNKNLRQVIGEYTA